MAESEVILGSYRTIWLLAKKNTLKRQSCTGKFPIEINCSRNSHDVDHLQLSHCTWYKMLNIHDSVWWTVTDRWSFVLCWLMRISVGLKRNVLNIHLVCSSLLNRFETSTANSWVLPRYRTTVSKSNCFVEFKTWLNKFIWNSVEWEGSCSVKTGRGHYRW